MGLAYLLARFADTLTDSGRLQAEERLSHLSLWEKAILENSSKNWKNLNNIGSFSDSEAQLLLFGPTLLEGLKSLAEPDLLAIQEVLQTLISGMRWDLKTFSLMTNETPKLGCKNLQTFDWYCFSIAGCVGRFWVKIFGLPQNLEPLAIEYGKGLQRINILRDVAEDWNRKRIYLPEDQLSRVGLNGETPPWTQAGWKNFVADYIRETRGLLRYGANFCDSLPYRSFRLRWASRLPLEIGLETLKILEQNPERISEHLKIPRSLVKRISLRSMVDVMLNRILSPRFKE